MTTNSRQRQRVRQWGLLGAVVVVLAGMVAYNALRPAATTADRVDSLSSAVLGQDWEKATPEQHAEFRQQWERLSQDERKQVFHAVARTRIAEVRERTKGLPATERAAWIQQRVQQMRREHDRIPPVERERIRERLRSSEGQDMVRTAMELYLTEFTARERAELDPLMHEWLAQIERLAGR